MSGSYIPTQDQGLDNWSNTFQAGIAASPGTYGLAAGDAVSITSAYNTYHDAYLLGGVVQPHSQPVNPATRTPSTVAAKDVAKAAGLIVFRTYAQIIQNNAGVSDMDKSAIGITVRKTSRTPIPAPGTTPLMALVGSTHLQQTLRFADSATPTVKAKPFGALQMELWRGIAVAAITDPTLCDFYGLITKTPFPVDFMSGDVGKFATYFSRWTTRRGLVGPWSTSLVIAIL